MRMGHNLFWRGFILNFVLKLTSSRCKVWTTLVLQKKKSLILLEEHEICMGMFDPHELRENETSTRMVGPHYLRMISF